MKFKKLIKKLTSGKKPLLAILIDPDKYNAALIRLADKSNAACFLVGGSKLESGDTGKAIASIKKISRKTTLIFPGDETQLTPLADGLLLPSLLSGRNPEYLIEKQVAMAPLIKKMKLPHLPMAYLLIKGSRKSTTQQVTGTSCLDPANATYIVNTALAAQQLGFKAIYLEAGSGAKTEVPSALIKQVKKAVRIPLIVGGGINSRPKVMNAIKAGANMIVIGNALEKSVELLSKINSSFK